MAEVYAIPFNVLDALVKLAAKAPVPYEQTQPLWAAVQTLKPVHDQAARKNDENDSAK